MPLFGFVCDECQHEHELLIRADAKPDCPDCGSAHMTKLMSAFAPQTVRAAPAGAGTVTGRQDDTVP